MFDQFDIENIDKSSYFIGKLNRFVIGKLELNMEEKDILIGADKISYAEKHMHKFSDFAEYKKHIEAAPYIIQNPEYIGKHPDGQSIEYIRKVDDLMLVAVKVKPHGFLWVKSIFPITESKLEYYKRSGRVIKLE